MKCVFEIHQDFGQQTVALLESKGFQNVEVVKDLFGCNRIFFENNIT